MGDYELQCFEELLFKFKNLQKLSLINCYIDIKGLNVLKNYFSNENILNHLCLGCIFYLNFR
jgi:hypothetical protein